MLNQFPPEILSCIVAHSDIIHRLWLCGDHALHARLSSTVTSLSLIHIPLVNFSAPQWLLQLHKLKHLSLSSATQLVPDSNNNTSILENMPCALESLEIESRDAGTVFLDRVASADGRPSPYIHIGALLPNLQSLTIRCEMNTLTYDFFKSLPPTLTSLVVASGRFELPFLADLPRSLQYLDLDLAITYQPSEDAKASSVLQDLSNMPPGLVIQRLRFTTSTQPEDVLSKLPPGLLSLQTTFITSPAMALLLPRSLVALDLFHVPQEVWSRLSSSASTALDNDHSGGNSASTGFWPPSLQDLKVGLTLGEPGVFEFLPRSLRLLRLTVSVSGPEREVTINAHELPPLLTDLTLAAPNFHKLQVEGQFWPCLTHLNVTSDVDPFDLFAALPASIEDLGFNFPAIGFRGRQKFGLAFPPKLKTLRVSKWRADWFHELPSTLIQLNIETLLHTQLNAFNLFPGLPTSLTSLDIGMLDSKLAICAPFSAGQLPSLLHMWLAHNLQLPPSSFEHLPRSMKSLDVVTFGLEKSIDCVALLPPNLERCNLFRAACIKGDMLGELWPPRAWRCLLGDHDRLQAVRRLRQRILSGDQPLPMVKKSGSPSWFSSLVDSIFK